jgi:hypothetical protein
MVCRWVGEWHKHYDPALDAQHRRYQHEASKLHKASNPTASHAQCIIVQDVASDKSGELSGCQSSDCMSTTDQGCAAEV